jgi:hypothetical protein
MLHRCESTRASSCCGECVARLLPETVSGQHVQQPTAKLMLQLEPLLQLHLSQVYSAQSGFLGAELFAKTSYTT